MVSTTHRLCDNRRSIYLDLDTHNNAVAVVIDLGSGDSVRIETASRVRATARVLAWCAEELQQVEARARTLHECADQLGQGDDS